MREFVFRNLGIEIFAYEIYFILFIYLVTYKTWNPGLWNPEYSSWNLESNKRLESGIRFN